MHGTCIKMKKIGEVYRGFKDKRKRELIDVCVCVCNRERSCI
jgi:hypothetical protein